MADAEGNPQQPPHENPPPVEPHSIPVSEAGDFGADALSGTTLSDDISVIPDTVIRDPELAHVVGEAENSGRTIELMAKNIEDSALPEKDKSTLAKKMRDHAEELASAATAEYEASQERFNKTQDSMLGKLLAVAEGRIAKEEAVLVLEYGTKRGQPQGDTDLTPYQINALKESLFGALGIENVDTTDAFEYDQERFTRERKVYSSDLGIKVFVDSFLDVGYSGMTKADFYSGKDEFIQIALTSAKNGNFEAFPPLSVAKLV